MKYDSSCVKTVTEILQQAVLLKSHIMRIQLVSYSHLRKNLLKADFSDAECQGICS
jgi:hypothetical protein